MRFSTEAGGGGEAPLRYCLQGYLKAHHVVNLLLVVTVSCQIGGKIQPKALSLKYTFLQMDAIFAVNFVCLYVLLIMAGRRKN